MAFPLSPGVNVSEIDLTTVVPSVLTTAGAFAGYFTWGPVGVIKQVDSQITLATTFTGGSQVGPDSNSAISFFSASNFLAYGNNLNVVRSVGANSNNAVTGTAALAINNENVFQYVYLNQNNGNVYGAFAARYPGALGNSLGVAVCANTSAFNTFTYANYFTSAPGTSAYAASAGGTNDEMHIVVYDAGGLITGTANTVLETYPFVSKAIDATNVNNGSSNYYKQVIFNNSKYVYAMDPVDYATAVTTWGKRAAGISFDAPANQYLTFAKGSDDVGTDANLQTAWTLFENKETVNISLCITGNASVTIQQFVIDNIATARGDCIAFISPPASAVINNSGSETTSIQTWLTSLSRSNSYTVADSGWKYQFDQYNNVYRWIPLNADVAGLCVYTDSVAQPWYSPAGFNRGAIKNSIKLAWNPSKSYRDTLYSAGVNPVVSFPGQGTVLFGDKTLQAKPSAFDRINVRRLFIILEKTISRAAQYSLFELNDAYTQSQFVNLVTPFLRSVQGTRGITDFKVVCDSTNNTPAVIDANQFVGDIYIKPARSINFIQLNFVAVGTGVNFNTVVGING
jgi:Phage tail sheath protein subtilisin-like domain/Phage tail sheath C-terminal domain